MSDPPLPEGDSLDAALSRFREAWFAGEGPDPEAHVRAFGNETARPDLAREIEAFLSVVNVLQHASESSRSPPLPERVGPYRVLEALGEGGMGVVYLAEQLEPVRRRVALKVLRGAAAGPSERARFRFECRSLALMNHDHIARLFDAGEDEHGNPWLAMEYVEGRPITEFCRQRHVPLPARLELFRRVCEAVHHAHQKGVIHRDLKPTNVLALERRGTLVPKVIDFGLARFFEAVDPPLRTRVGQILGTPEYMSPEQAAGRAEAVDVRTDVYSLGTLLYELLTGSVPFPDLRSSSPAGIERRLRETSLELPSRRVRRTAPGDASWRSLRGDLDVIVERALAKAPEERYQSARELADDVQRHLRHLPLVAVSPGPWRRLAKFVRRRRYVVVPTGIVLLALGVALVSTLQSALRVRRALDDVERITRPISTQAHLRGARDALEALPPPWPEHAEAYQEWLREHEEPLERTLRAIAANRATLGTVAIGEELRSVLMHSLDELEREARTFVAPAVRRVRDDLAWSAEVEERSLREHAAAWRRAAAEVRADPRTGGLDLAPQMGLVPLGADPRSGLQEFAHLRSGSVPRRDTHGELVSADDAGIVFVLLPGGAFHIGAQPVEPGAPGYDPGANVETMPVREIVLDPFLIAKHELTQAQWARLSFAERPAHYPSGEAFCGAPITPRNPVESVSHAECEALLRRFGLRLPTEAQWEYAARGGSTTRFHCGDGVEGLDGFANLADRTAHSCHQYRLTCVAAELEDGHGMHAPVGSFAPNAFGLHDVHGNVAEWCDAYYGSYRNPHRPGDGFWPRTDQEERILRGGSFSSLPDLATSARRQSAPAAIRAHDLGARAARRLFPAPAAGGGSP